MTDMQPFPAVEAAKPFVVDLQELIAPQVALPPNWKRESLADVLGLPPRWIKRLTEVSDIPSFLAYFTRYAVNPTVYAFRNEMFVGANLDDHKDGKNTDHCAHILRRKYIKSRRFLRWERCDRKQMSQLEFAAFLEDSIRDVVQPENGAIMQLVLSFKAFKGATLQSQVDLANGDTSFVFMADSKQNGQAVFPDHLMLRVPVFQDEPQEWDIAARLRYRIDGNTGRLAFWYELVETDDLIDRAFDKAVQDLQAQLTGHTILRCP